MSNTTHQTGSALWFILIGIILFGAISAVVTSSGKGNMSATLSPEQAKLYAGEIINYANQVSQAVRKVMLVNDCTDTQVSFERAPYDGSDSLYDNPNAPTDFSCHIMHPNGGNIKEMRDYPDWLAETTHSFWYISGTNCVTDIGTDSVTCTIDEKDLVIKRYGLKKEICEAINSRLLGDENILSYNVTPTAFVGVYTAGTATPFQNNTKSFCFLDSGGVTADHYTFVHTLIAR